MMFPRSLKGTDNYKLSSDAKLLYIYLLDRSRLSEKNGWTDEKGVYIYYSRDEMSQDLGVSLSTVKRVFAKLKAAGLATVGDCGTSLSPKIYVKNLLPEYSVKQVKSKERVLNNKTYDNDEVNAALLEQFMGL